jgi:hypothetical protein
LYLLGILRYTFWAGQHVRIDRTGFQFMWFQGMSERQRTASAKALFGQDGFGQGRLPPRTSSAKDVFGQGRLRPGHLRPGHLRPRTSSAKAVFGQGRLRPGRFRPRTSSAKLRPRTWGPQLIPNDAVSLSSHRRMLVTISHSHTSQKCSHHRFCLIH